MSDQGKANYTAVAARIGGQFDHYDKLTPNIRAAYDAGADAVEKWLADAPVDEDMPGNEPALATVDLHRWYAVITQPDGTAKVIGHTDDGLGYYDSVDEWEAKNS